MKKFQLSSDEVTSSNKSLSRGFKNGNWISLIIIILFLGFFFYAQKPHLSELDKRILFAFFNAFSILLELVVLFNVFQIIWFVYILSNVKLDSELSDPAIDLTNKLYAFPNYEAIDFVTFILVGVLGIFVFLPLSIDALFVIWTGFRLIYVKKDFELASTAEFASKYFETGNEDDEGI